MVVRRLDGDELMNEREGVGFREQAEECCIYLRDEKIEIL